MGSLSTIQEGTVIDHLHAGNGLKIVHLLRLMNHEKRVIVELNLKSISMGRKDCIKIEKTLLIDADIELIAIFAPIATINIIKNYNILKKFSVIIPEKIQEILACPNPQCITHVEPCQTLFTIEENNHTIFLQCHFCEKLFSHKEMEAKFK